ncbi:sigma 54-interacting transcriptional regulator [Desulfolucanica intricata]|uniref:sigma 54-interacting transcriptional regulator n=1 Tax=Desulfolucanica intricata TaxID=1285191 RepID=UPI00082FAD28|nr:sigma 54-interacting transcriptional regulator [Desulfolucanica intricata]
MTTGKAALPKDSLDVQELIKNELTLINSLSKNAIIAIDYTGRVIAFNKASEEVFNISADKVMGRIISDVMPGNPEIGLLKVLRTGKSHIGRKFIEGNTLYVANRTPIIKNNVIIGAIGIAQEISELQQVVSELDSVKEMKTTLETILDTGYDGYLLIDKDGYIVSLNKAFAKLIGVKPEEVGGKHVKEVVPETELHLVPSLGKSQIAEVVNLNGREVVVMRSPIKKDGRTIGAVSKVIFKDVDGFISSARRVYSSQRKKTLDFNQAVGVRYTLDNLIGSCPEMINLKQTIQRVANGPSTVLIRGESGTGKELIAQAVHVSSNRCLGPFVKVNCAAIPENLLESELFGYVEGAFTGAKKGGQIGKFEQANGGTIFLDEIGDMPLVMQAKLLRVLQEKEVERLGDNQTRKVDVRVVAATNRPLEELIEKNSFREDLFYRLNVVTLNVPPLRERIEDLRILTNYFLAKFNAAFGLNVSNLSNEAWSVLENYHWPGNVRELENVIEFAFNMVDSEVIDLVHLPDKLQIAGQNKQLNSEHHKVLNDWVEQAEKDAIIHTLTVTNGNKKQASQILGISRAWLYKKIAQYNINL